MGGLIYDSIPLLELSFQSPIGFTWKIPWWYLDQQYINGKGSFLLLFLYHYVFPCSLQHFTKQHWDSGNVAVRMSQTSFSLYLHNQWTDFHKPSCAGKPQMRAIRTYAGCTKATTNDWDIRTSVAVKASSTNISQTARQIRTIELALESAHQYVYNNIWCVSKQ